MVLSPAVDAPQIENLEIERQVRVDAETNGFQRRNACLGQRRTARIRRVGPRRGAALDACAPRSAQPTARRAEGASVDAEDLAADPAAGIGGQVDGELAHLFGRPGAAQRDRAQDHVAVLAEQALAHVGGDEAGGDHVGADPWAAFSRAAVIVSAFAPALAAL